MKRTIYRDRSTGQFVSKATWTRSRAHDGTQYVRQRVRVTKPKEEPEIVRKPIRDLEDLEDFIEESDEEMEEIEFEGAFDSP